MHAHVAGGGYRQAIFCCDGIDDCFVDFVVNPVVQGHGKGREVAFSELAGHQNKDNFFVMAATQRYRYLYDKENDLPCELFDLEKDPDELHNLIDDPAHAGIRKDMHKDYVAPFMAS